MITSITHVAGTNRIHKVGTQAMVFDAAGNLSSYAGKTFTHGADGRLRSTTTSAGTVTYQYDGLGRRVSKSGPATLVPGGFVRYVYDAAHHLIGEYKADGTPIKEYVWIDDLPVAMIRFQGPWSLEGFAIETDHLGTPRLLTDATRAPRWRWTSPPFGEVLPEDDPSGLGAVTFNLRFPGQYYDKETGLHYNFNRYYDPGTGRYVESDPIGLQGGWNTYSYVRGNPLSYTDPTGEFAQYLPWLLGGGGVGIGLIYSQSDPTKGRSSSSEIESTEPEKCCERWERIYEPNSGKHLSQGRWVNGNWWGPEPDPIYAPAALKAAVPVSTDETVLVGHIGDQVIQFNLTRADPKACVKIYHGFIVSGQPVPARQDVSNAAKKAGFPGTKKWPWR